MSLTFRVERVSLASPAGEAGLRNLDYLIQVNDTKVFDDKCMLSHKELVEKIKYFPGDTLELEIERGEIHKKVSDVVPSFDLLIPKPESGIIEDKNAYYLDAMKHGYENMESPGMFTAVGKLRLKTGKTGENSLGLYSEETLDELSGSGGHGFVDPEKLAPDACPAAKNRKRFNPAKSNTLAVLALHEKGGNMWPEFLEEEDPSQNRGVN